MITQLDSKPLHVQQAVAKFKFPYTICADSINREDSDSIGEVVHQFSYCYDLLQQILIEYNELKRERDILEAENNLLKEEQKYG